MQVSVKQFTLPFLVKSDDQAVLDADSEAAALYVFSELDRKSGGLISKQSEEKIAFMVKAGYPLWLVPRGEITFVFDGLGRSRYNWVFCESVNTSFVLENLEASSKLKETYLGFLRDAPRSLEQTFVRKEHGCDSLIVSQDFFEELSVYRKEATEIFNQTSDVELLSSCFNENKINLVISEIEGLQNIFIERTETLKRVMQLIEKTTSQYVVDLQFKAEALKDEAGAKIRAQEEIINPKIAAFTKEYQSRIKRLEKNILIEQSPLEKQKAKIERTIKSLSAKIEQYIKNAKVQAKKKNAYSEKNWGKKAKWSKKEISELQKQHEKISKQLKSLSEYRVNEVKRLNFDLQEIINHERQPIVDIEVSRDADLVVFKHEILDLEKATKPVLESLDSSIKQRESLLSKIEPLGFRTDPKIKKTCLLYVPFFVTCYCSGLSRRYLIVSPSILGKIGFSAKIKGAFGKTKFRDFFNCRFKSFGGLVEKLRLNVSANYAFEMELERFAEKNNLLNSNISRVNVKKGLFSLREAGWLSEAEYQGFLKSI